MPLSIHMISPTEPFKATVQNKPDRSLNTFRAPSTTPWSHFVSDNPAKAAVSIFKNTAKHTTIIPVNIAHTGINTASVKPVSVTAIHKKDSEITSNASDSANPTNFRTVLVKFMWHVNYSNCFANVNPITSWGFSRSHLCMTVLNACEILNQRIVRGAFDFVNSCPRLYTRSPQCYHLGTVFKSLTKEHCQTSSARPNSLESDKRCELLGAQRCRNFDERESGSPRNPRNDGPHNWICTKLR